MPQEEKFDPQLLDYKDPNGVPYPVGANGRINFSKISGKLPLP